MVIFEIYSVSKSYLKIFCLSLCMVVLLVSKVGSCRIGQQRVGDLLLPAVACPLPLFHAVVVIVVDVDGVVGGEVLLGHPDLPTSPSLCYWHLCQDQRSSPPPEWSTAQPPTGRHNDQLGLTGGKRVHTLCHLCPQNILSLSFFHHFSL